MTATMGHSRRTIASFDAYEGAQELVDRLADRDFPVDRVTIIGSDLRFVERVTGKLTTLRAALAGAATGAWIGLLLAIFFGIFLPEDVSWLGVFLYWIILGALVGAALGAIFHGLQGGRRDFSSVSTIQPTHFDVQVADDVAGQAESMLGPRHATSQAAPQAPVPPPPAPR